VPAAAWFVSRVLAAPALPVWTKALWIMVCCGITAVSQVFAVDFVKQAWCLWRPRLAARARARAPPGGGGSKRRQRGSIAIFAAAHACHPGRN
jgi:hypothetical protein